MELSGLIITWQFEIGKKDTISVKGIIYNSTSTLDFMFKRTCAPQTFHQPVRDLEPEPSFIVRQRVNLQTVPVEIEVPISKPASAKAKTKS
jgi:hypothetical protein